MPARSKILDLPDAVRVELDRRLSSNGFSGYDELTAWLNDQEHDVDISRSSLGRYGKSLEARLGRLQDSARLSEMIVEHMPDAEGAMGQASVALAQSQVMDVLYFLGEAEDTVDPEERLKLLRSASLSLSQLARAGVTVKKYASDVRERARAVAAEVGDVVRKAGLSDEAADLINRKILGVAP